MKVCKRNRVCTGWLFVLIAACAYQVTAHAQPAWETISLPPGIAGKAEIYFGEEVYTGLAEPLEPDQLFHFEIHREWVRSEQYLRDGSFGWQLFDFTMATYDDSVIYNFKSMRGSRFNRFALYGDSRSDNWLSPTGWIRMLHVRNKLGEPIHVESKDGLTIYSWQIAGGHGTFRVSVESSGRVVHVERLYPGSKDVQVVYEYTDWVSLGEAGEHPQTIRSVIYADKNIPNDEPLYTLIRIVEMKPLTEDAEPTGYTLPIEAIITDRIDNVIRNGEGTIIGDLAEATEASTAGAGPNTPFRLSSGWLAGAGVLMLVGAAVIWEVRRRRG